MKVLIQYIFILFEYLALPSDTIDAASYQKNLGHPV